MWFCVSAIHARKPLTQTQHKHRLSQQAAMEAKIAAREESVALANQKLAARRASQTSDKAIVVTSGPPLVAAPVTTTTIVREEKVEFIDDGDVLVNAPPRTASSGERGPHTPITMHAAGLAVMAAQPGTWTSEKKDEDEST